MKRLKKIKLLVTLFIVFLFTSFSRADIVLGADNPEINIKEGTLYEIVHVASGKVLDITDESYYNGAKIQIWQSFPQHMNQLFLFEKDELGFKILSFHSGKVVGILNRSKDNETPIVQSDDQKHLSQRWSVLDNGDGTVTFENKFAGKVMDVQYGGLYDGCPLWSYQPNSSPAQKFVLREYNFDNVISATWERDLVKHPYPSINIEKNCVISNAWKYGLDDTSIPVLKTNFTTQLQYLNSSNVFELLKNNAYRKSFSKQLTEILMEEGFDAAAEYALKKIGVKCPYIGTIISIAEVLGSSNSDWNRFVSVAQEGKGIIIVTQTRFDLIPAPRSFYYTSDLRSYPSFPDPYTQLHGAFKKYYDIVSYNTYSFLVWEEDSFSVDDICLSQGSWHAELK